MTAEQAKANPKALLQAKYKGVDLKGMPLKRDGDGMLSEGSKKELNKLIGHMSSSLNAEVLALVFEKQNGTLGTRLFSTGERDGVSYIPPKGKVIYDAHTHPDMDPRPSKTDLENKTPGAENVIVPADEIPGNETGDYVTYG
jgi:proteasome lid subunit RPN8/RPN11